MIYCNICGEESKGGILYRDYSGIYNICNSCKKEEERIFTEGKKQFVDSFIKHMDKKLGKDWCVGNTNITINGNK